MEKNTMSKLEAARKEIEIMSNGNLTLDFVRTNQGIEFAIVDNRYADWRKPVTLDNAVSSAADLI